MQDKKGNTKVSEDALAKARLAEYRQRRRVELLRQQLYAQPDPSQSSELSQALRQAEEVLYRLEKERQAKEGGKRQGVLLDTGGAGEKPGGIMLGPDTTEIDAQVLLRMSHVPTGIVHLLHAERTPLVTFSINNTGDEYVRLRLNSFVEGYSAQAVDTVELLPDQSVEIRQLPTFFPDRIRPVTELTRATLHIRIDDLDGKTEQQSSFPIWLLARTSAYNGVEDPLTGEWIDLSVFYAAWVTPNAPEVMQVLRRAADLHPDRKIVGYQADPDGIKEQVKTIFDALKAEDILYVNSVLSFGATRGEYTQRVRLPRESIANRSANCLDGTVLVASVLEAASLNPGIVLVPGHAFVAWETQDGNGQWDYLETTMIGSHEFEVAHESGQRQARQQKALFDQIQDPYYFQLLPIPDLRARYGITPME
jgi:hypothetical protein